jgi:hypothetical protein
VSLYDVDGGTVFLAEEDGMSLRRAAVMSEGDENGDHHPRARRARAEELLAAPRWSAALSSSTAPAPVATPAGARRSTHR